MREQHDIPVLLTGCLAAGGAGMFLIMSVLIGFGVSTLIGREAMYLCLLLELVNLLVLHARAGALLRSGKAPQPSPKMRLLRRVSGIGWLTGAVLLVGSLALLLFGLPLANIWVKLAAYIGVPVMMLSWAGCLIVFRRLRMSAAACAQEKGKVLLPSMPMARSLPSRTAQSLRTSGRAPPSLQQARCRKRTTSLPRSSSTAERSATTSIPASASSARASSR